MPYPCKRQLNEIFNVKNKRKCHDKKKQMADVQTVKKYISSTQKCILTHAFCKYRHPVLIRLSRDHLMSVLSDSKKKIFSDESCRFRLNENIIN